MPDIVRNSLLLGLVGTYSLQQLAESPVIAALAMAMHVAFIQMVAGHFKRHFSTAQSDQGVQDQERIYWTRCGVEVWGTGVG